MISHCREQQELVLYCHLCCVTLSVSFGTISSLLCGVIVSLLEGTFAALSSKQLEY